MTGTGVHNLYQQVILDHYRRPRHRGHLSAPHGAARAVNPLCGDEIEVAVVVEDGRLVDAAFDGCGCAVSQASASMMMERLHGRAVRDVAEVYARVEGLLQARVAPADEPTELGDLAALSGVRESPVRVKCALLPWRVLRAALDQVERRSEA